VSRPPARCIACQVNRVAWVTPRVDYCYECLPGGPFTAPPCRACNSSAYFSDGQCEKCHPGGPRHPGSCRGCLAWGVYRAHNWHCWICRWWQGHYPLGDCLHCARTTRVADRGVCRLCLEQARLVQQPGRALELADANAFGQQLFLANMRFQRPRTPRLRPAPRDACRHVGALRPVGWRQEKLFELAPDPEQIKARAVAADAGLLAVCHDIAREHAARHGWSNRQRNDVIRSLRLLEVLQATPGAKINATDVLQLPRYDGNINSTLDVLVAADLLIDDRISHIERYFAGKTDGLPAPMREQLVTWLEVMLSGSSTAPRQRSRDPHTLRIQILGIAPILHAWAAQGHQSLAEITREQVRAALPPSGARRNFAEYGLRSLFRVLKARKLIFTNPTRGLPATPVNSTVPLPLDTEAIRQSLNSPDRAIALAVALVAFHALTSKQLRELALTDIVDGRLTIDGREIPLAGPALVRLRAWLDHRAQTWPATINPHLFVSRRSAPRLTQVGAQFPWRGTNLTPQALREDRIVQEIHATGGDVRRLCDLFGLSVEGALRYATALNHTDLETTHARVRPTRHNT
jgi:site-specific recombinase XerC